MTTNLLLIGRGRLATHLKKAWSGFNLDCWDRSHGEELLHSKLKNAKVILLAISDSAIADFKLRHEKVAPKDARWIHFSGALFLEGLTDLHPLMTFGPELYDEETYRKIPFVSASTATFPPELPLKNSLSKIEPAEKPLYHALCVLSGNFSNLLWRKAIGEFEKLGLPEDIARAYAEQSLKNVFDNPKLALTGPLVRGDQVTQEKNLRALGDDPYANVYRAFQKAYQEENP